MKSIAVFTPPLYNAGMKTVNFPQRRFWFFGLIAASLISFSAPAPRGGTKDVPDKPERFLKIAKWKLKVSWQASGNFADRLSNEGGVLSVKSSVGVNGRGEYLLIKRPDDGAYEWGTPEGDNPNVSVSYDGRKTVTISHAGGTFDNVWSIESEKPDGGSAKLEINPDAGTYDVHAVVYFSQKVISPPKGSKPEIVQNSISMTPRDAEYRKKNTLPESGFNLSGSHEFLARLGPLGDVDPQVKKKMPLMAPWTMMRVNWQLVPAGEEDVEAVIETPKGYQEWKPAADKTEDKAGPQPITVKARLHKKGEPDKPANRKAQFKFELVDTTRINGVCMNWPPSDSALDTYDLRIEQANNGDLAVTDGESGQKAETKKNVSEAAVTISCFDWGAYARLKVTAILDDDYKSEVLAYLDSDKSKHELKIPKDANDNFIADGWEKKNGVSGKRAEADDESSPEGDGHPGDGLTLFEEYRGFMENGTHIFGDLKKKDLFICNKIGAMAELGISKFEEISELAVHSKLKPGGRSGPAELEESRIINRNYTHRAHIVDQHGVFIDKGDEGTVSEASPLSGFEPTPGPPKKFEKVKIGLGFLGEEYSAYERASVIAHEILHCCSVWHHGQIDTGVRKFKTKTDAAGVKRIYVFSVDADENAPGAGLQAILLKEPNLIVDPNQPLLLAGINLWVGRKQGQHSGDTDCVMRYDCALCYINNSYKYVLCEEVFGLSLCTDGQGTGVNEPGRKPEPRFGNATAGKGNCKKQICVNDKYH
jgi:hypothetical protein